MRRCQAKPRFASRMLNNIEWAVHLYRCVRLEILYLRRWCVQDIYIYSWVLAMSVDTSPYSARVGFCMLNFQKHKWLSAERSQRRSVHWFANLKRPSSINNMHNPCSHTPHIPDQTNYLTHWKIKTSKNTPSPRNQGKQWEKNLRGLEVRNHLYMV